MATLDYYKNLLVYDLETEANKNWHWVEELQKIEQALQGRGTRRSIRLRDKIRERIEALEYFEWEEEYYDFADLLQDEPKEQNVFFPTDDILEIPFLPPDEAAGERWLQPSDLERITKLLESHNISQDPLEISKYGYKCRGEIQTKRSYGIPSQGHAVISAHQRPKQLIDLSEIRFVQEGIHPPGVFLRFSFGDPAVIAIVKVNEHMAVEGFFEFSDSELFETIIEAIALAFYRDLVVPGDTKKPKTEKVPGEPKPRKSKRSRTIPRIRYDSKISTIESYHQKIRHEVVGHMRRVSRDFIADDEREFMAFQAIKRRLPAGYTWVRPHKRGGHDIDVRLSDLEERTVFAPPTRASQELDELFR